MREQLKALEAAQVELRQSLEMLQRALGALADAKKRCDRAASLAVALDAERHARSGGRS